MLDIFVRYGMQRIRGASGQNNDKQIPRLKELMYIDPKRKHPFNNDEKGQPVLGSPKLFIIDDVMNMPAVAEIEGLGKDKNDPRKINMKDTHHFIDTAKYFASDDPGYMGDKWRDGQEDAANYGGDKTPVTGY